MADRTVEVTMTFIAKISDAPHAVDYDEHNLADLVRFHVGLSDLDMIDVDVSAFTITDAKES